MIKCKNCDANISNSTKICPQCGAKVKKPLYKRVWFWILIVLFIGGIGAGSVEEASSTVPEDTSTIPPIVLEEVIIPAEKPTETIVDNTTIGEKNALKSAKSYLRYSGFSLVGLCHQLEFEKYTTTEIDYAIANCEANWNEEAQESAKSYLKYSGFSESGLRGQLEFEGFLTEEIDYAIANCEANWNEEAKESATSYLNFMSFSKEELKNQLAYEGFTDEQINYALTAVGY